MSVLDRKLWRDALRLWGQGLAIALVLGAGVAVLVLGVGAQRALEETRSAYYERYHFADLFAHATRAPLAAADRVALIDGVRAVEARIQRQVILDVPGQREPATAALVSLPDDARPDLNRVHLTSGRLPEPLSRHEVLVNQSFADAHGFRPGDGFAAIMAGRKRDLVIAGTMLSPEFVYALGPGDLVPDDRRFAVVMAPYSALAETFDLDGAFDHLAVGLARGADPGQVMAEIDRILAPYGGTGAYDRSDQPSHAFLDAELTQLRGLSLIMPPIFLAVAAFLVNITVSRLIALEREQIGLLKALGYGSVAIALHYLKLVALIALVGIVLGWIVGLWLGRGMAQLYGEFFRFPFLVFDQRFDVFLLAASAALAAALLGAVQAIRGAVRLAPAVAMAPPAPTRFRHLFRARFGLLRHAPQALVMSLRNIARWPVRAALTTLGLALSIAVLIASLFATDSLDLMIEAQFFQADRQHATLTFADSRPERALFDVANLPGVLQAEPFRAVPVRLHHGQHQERTSLIGKPPAGDLSRVIDADHRPVVLPDVGLALSEMLAGLLAIGPGDRLLVEVMEGRLETLEVPVAAVIQQYLGLGAYMDLQALNRLLREGPRIDGVHVSYDRHEEDAFFAALKTTPVLGALTLQRHSLAKLEETLERNIVVMISVYAGLAFVIGFGVVYNAV
ncbi:MAG: FtsX-like permease family protein, partial [Geminicoccaceae bacterium]